jgi:glycosyltransferase involved in cell wall biosynthesis
MIKNTSSTPFFSVITCTYNSGKFLKKNINSVKAQTFIDYEHIFIDGFSNDGTREIIESYKKLNPGHVKVFLRKPIGISDAMNEGIKKAKGKYIIHLHSDDYFYDKKVLEDVYEFIKKNDLPDWIYGKIDVIEENGKNVGIFPKYKVLQLASSTLLKLFNFVPHQSVFIKKSILSEFGGFDENLKSSMDYDMWLRIALKTRWIFLNRIISNYTIRKGSQSSDKSKGKVNKDESIRVAKRHLSLIEFLLHSLVNIPMDAYNHTHR